MRFSLLYILMLLVIAFSAYADANNPCNPCSKAGTVFNFADKMARNTITFKSQAPLEDIVGTTNKIKGHFRFDPAQPEMGGQGVFSVPVASLNTGIPLRDEHLQSKDWLNAGKYPMIKLEIQSVKNIKQVKSSENSASYDLTLAANFTLNGKTKSLDIPGRITYMEESELTRTKLPGDLLAARANFEMDLSDYGIKGPAGKNLIGTKVGKIISVEVSLVGSSSAPAIASNPCGEKAMNPCNPCGGKAMNPCNPCGGKK